MITIEQAFEIRGQIIRGEWFAPVIQKYSFDPLDLQCYELERGNLSIWVANGFLGMKFREGSHCLKIPFICKLVIYNAAMSEKYKAINWERSKRKNELKLKICKSLGGEQ